MILRFKTTKKATQDDIIINGFTLIEVLIGVLILAVAILTIYSLFNMSLKVIWESKAKITATQLANQKIEIAHNLNYADVGTVNGIPAGNIPQTENIIRNGINFVVQTQVFYIDDEFDGTLGGNPDDTLNTDYKRIKVTVSWPYRYGHKPIILMTNIVPPGLESSVGGGTLKILVYNAFGEPVPQANVSIINNLTDPVININTQTDDQGYVILPGSPESTEGYEITVTKEGYSTDQTYNTTPELPSPEKSHASVFENQTTNISFAIDKLSNLEIAIQNENNISLSDVEINIKGGKTIGLDEDELPVYKFNHNYFSNHLGKINLNNIEWDSYSFILPEDSVYNISETIPIQPLSLLPNTVADITITLVPKATHSALIIIKDITEHPIASSTIHFYTSNPIYDGTFITGQSGQAYFTPWIEATSTIEITANGYENYSDTFDLSGYHVEEVIMVQP